MKTYYTSELTEEQRSSLLQRPAIDNESSYKAVRRIIDDVKAGGLSAAMRYSLRYDGFQGDSPIVTEDEIELAKSRLPENVKLAIINAAKNIEAFHIKGKPRDYQTEVVPGVNCQRLYRPIENVGIYVPGGSASLPSTMLMLGIPAKIAGVKRIVACSPAKYGCINDAMLFAANYCGISEFYKIGGAQAIALMSYGDERLRPVDKIFGPGNQFVTAAKALVSVDPKGCPIDMPSGPSEVLIIADGKANPYFVALDLLSQAEHGPDSQVILVTTSETVKDSVIEEVERIKCSFERIDIINRALENSFVLLAENLSQAFSFSNDYAPEHLILSIENASGYIDDVVNAGSVFLGPYSPESAGDYASGTNHSLPTYGYAKAMGGIAVESFMKAISFQELSKAGLKSLESSIVCLAETEGLAAHAEAVKGRLK